MKKAPIFEKNRPKEDLKLKLSPENADDFNLSKPVYSKKELAQRRIFILNGFLFIFYYGLFFTSLWLIGLGLGWKTIEHYQLWTDFAYIFCGWLIANIVVNYYFIKKIRKTYQLR